jgi:hypothetical protein
LDGTLVTSLFRSIEREQPDTMSVIDQNQLAEAIRLHFLSCPFFPVKPKDFGIDTFSEEGETITLHMEVGKVIKTYVDGTRIVYQPVSLFYRTSNTSRNEERSSMLGALNKIGDWLLEGPPLNLKPKFLVRSFAQASMASLYSQENTVLGYQATYSLEYETI